MSQFTVSTDQVATTSDLLQGLLSELRVRIDVANASVAGVVGASWTGAAADDFAAEWQALLADTAVGQAVLTVLIARLRAAEDTYEQVELVRTAIADAAAETMVVPASPVHERDARGSSAKGGAT
ncbi:WXG100 family type VII secretion target [Demequina subtropica]|uniref:WXG100 family type VII secretion target n=1 Tax=Demequina subtropica TaxID=1638989 RepID=UPI00078618AE|nr:WXG100 family type VII secretion target [Demequina subtropica]